ncbi:MAG TPA: cytochrome c [Chromatiales bacterium]|nr:cytochrome c [Chromatiales bacterium]
MKKTSWMVLLAAGLLVAGQAMAAGDPAAGKAKTAACAGCHGADGHPPKGTKYPALAGRDAAELVAAMKEYKEGKRKDPTMQMMMKPLSDQDMENIAAYFASQK